MSRRRVALVSLASTLGALVLVLVGAAAWVLYTPSGLAWITQRLASYAGEGLTLEGVSGTLASGAAIGRIRFAGADIAVTIEDATLALSPLSLLKLEPSVRFLEASRVAVTTKPGEPRDKPPDTLALPADFEIERARIGRLVVDMGEGPLVITDLALAYEGGERRHRLRELTLMSRGYVVKLSGTIDADAPFALDADLKAQSYENDSASAQAKLGGHLSAIRVTGGARAEGGTAAVKATLTPYAALPISAADIKAKDVDLAAFVPSLPRTRLSANVELATHGAALRGSVHAANAIPGPYDEGLLPVASVDAKLTTDLDVAGLTALAVDLGKAGTITGTGKMTQEHATLALSTRRLDLAALHTRMRATQLAGSADIELTKNSQSVEAVLRQDGIALEAEATRTADVVDIARFRAVARGGVASGSGTIGLAASRPFALDARLTRFDPAAWGDFPRGSINGTFAARGTLEKRSAEVTLAIADSRWLGAPLAARASASVTPERVRAVEVDARLGGNHIRASGALGAPKDVLTVGFDAPRLELVDRALHGTLRGTAQLSGPLRALAVRFDVAGSALTHNTYGRVKALAAKGDLTLAQSGAMQLEATLSGVSTAQAAIDSASVRLGGTRAAHRLAIAARGERLDFRASASGALVGNSGWRGTIHELVNRGDVPLRLTQPVALIATADRARVEPFTVEVVGGRLNVTELSYVRGVLATSGRIVDLPVQPLLALAGNPAGARGNLRLSGAWDIRNAPQWLGNLSLRRASGDLSVGVEHPITLGLNALGADAKLGPRAIEVRAEIGSALARVNAGGRIFSVGGRYTAASPIELSGAADVDRLAPLAAFIDTAMLIDGEAHARVTARGTLGDPRLSGPLTARRLAVALPVEGVNLTDGTLDATLDAQTIRVTRFSIRGGEGVMTAAGTLARGAFDEASLDWRAERFTALARPDRRLVVSGSGNAGLKSGKLSLTGKLAADEGEFEIGGSDLPRLADDIVVAGRTERRSTARQPPQPKKLGTLSLDLSIALGNRVHVLGHGLSVWLAGNVHVYTGPGGDILAKGVVSTRNGTFAAYGQRLEIDRGRIYFNGPVANPSVDIVAMRKRQAVEAGVAVTGTLSNPLVRIVSDPQVPQGEALSWLVLGRAPGEATAGELSALPLAANAAFGKATGGIKQRLNLDELALGGGAGGQFVTLGKRITDKLYVGFEQGLGAVHTVLRLEYALTRRLSLRAQTGETSLLGVFYRYRWD